MIKILLGDIKNGRLLRLPYLGYSILLSALMIAIGFAVVAAIGAGEHMIGGDLQQAQDQMREMFSGPALLVMAVVMPLFLFMGANIMAKRIRDIGLPGWWSVLAVFIVSVIVSFIFSSEVSSTLNTLVWIILLLIPSNALAGGSQPAQ